MKDITVTVSGSFHRHIDAIMEAVEEFRSLGIEVLSPKDPRIVDGTGSFLFVASDRYRSIRLVQDGHLAAISQSSFLWLVSPDGYIGQSASLEIGFAIAYGTPIYGRNLPPDLTLIEYIQEVNNIDDAVRVTRAYAMQSSMFDRTSSLLVNPPSVSKKAHGRVETVDRILRAPGNLSESDIAHQIEIYLSAMGKSTSLPVV